MPTMSVKELFDQGGDVGDVARAMVLATSKFFEVLASNNIELQEAQSSEPGIDYDAPVEAAYKKTYTPITINDIHMANKQMSEAISGEKWFEGFWTAIQIMMMFAR